MEKQPEDKQFLEYVVKSIVSIPDDVIIDRTVDEMGVLLSVHVNVIDMSRVIGKKGVTVAALRELARIIGMKNNSRVSVKIKEPGQ
jgi:predicted RNA-binding protein YlqC (UPF0109 family)